MKNFWIFLIIFFSINLHAKEHNNQLNLLIWADYIQGDVLKQFEQETGIKVNTNFIDSHFSLESKIISANKAYDVVIPTQTNFALH